MFRWGMWNLEADVGRYRDGIAVGQNQDRQLWVVLLCQLGQGGQIRLSVRFRGSRLV